jgi:flavin reductase (DIM6/NTAB) family NADH-FMN oxidoreductase RutF
MGAFMFYRPADGHGLPHNPFNAIVTPRPIGWIATRGADGSENLAPYSFFNAVAYVPPQVIFSSTGAKSDRAGTKDSVANIRETGVFCVNIVAEAMIDAMNQSPPAAGRRRPTSSTSPALPAPNAKPSPARASNGAPRRWNAA